MNRPEAGHGPEPPWDWHASGCSFDGAKRRRVPPHPVHNGTGDYIKKPITAHGAKRLADPTRLLTAAEEAAVLASHTLRANNGATVFIHQFKPGRFNVIIKEAGGFMTRSRHLTIQ